MNARDIYKDALKEIKLMQLATCKNNKPWLCNVWYVMDEDENIYWISRDTRRHSVEIEHNAYVAATFHRWFDDGLGQKGQALIMSGKAVKLQGEECRKPYELYAHRYPNVLDFQTLDAFLGDEGHHFFYKLTPDEIVWWDEVNFLDDPKQTVLG